MGKIIDGKAIAAEIREEIAADVVALKEQGVTPGLAVVLVGDDPASRVYVTMKEKACEKAGIFSDEHKLPAETTEAQLLALIEELNNDPRIDGILVQLPLPDHIDESKVLESISPAKDADGFHPYNVGRLVTGNPLYQPCTPYGVMKMLEHTGVDLKGKEVVVVGSRRVRRHLERHLFAGWQAYCRYLSGWDRQNLGGVVRTRVGDAKGTYGSCNLGCVPAPREIAGLGGLRHHPRHAAPR